MAFSDIQRIKATLALQEAMTVAVNCIDKEVAKGRKTFDELFPLIVATMAAGGGVASVFLTAEGVNMKLPGEGAVELGDIMSEMSTRVVECYWGKEVGDTYRKNAQFWLDWEPQLKDVDMEGLGGKPDSGQ
jgi:hypothetical protein